MILREACIPFVHRHCINPSTEAAVAPLKQYAFLSEDIAARTLHRKAETLLKIVMPASTCGSQQSVYDALLEGRNFNWQAPLCVHTSLFFNDPAV